MRRFAVQANISIGFGDISACAGQGQPLVGRFTVEAGLKRLLAGTGCSYRRLDSGAFAVQAAASRRRPTVTRMTSPVDDGLHGDISELVVVATRRATQADHLAYGVSSVSASVLRDQGVHDLGDLSLLSAAMTTTNLGMGRDKIILRGVSDGALTGLTQSLVGLYLDDARLTFNAPDPDLRLVDIERVEVLRGPQGALYGAGSLGGIVQMVSAEPDPARPAAWAAVSGGFTQGGGPSNSEDAMINAPLFSGRGAARLVLYHEEDGGYIRDSQLNINDANQSTRDGGRLAVKLDLDPRLTVSAGMIIQAIADADTQYATLGDAAYARATRLREPSDNDFRQYHVSVSGDLGWADAHGSAAFIDQDIFNRYDASEAPPIHEPPGLYAFDERDHVNSVVTEETLASQSTAKVQWLAGLSYAHTWQTTDIRLTDEAPPTAVIYDERRNDVLDDGALFGQASIPLYAHISLTLGGRLFTNRDQASNTNTYPGGVPSAPFSGRVGETGFAPKIVISDRLGRGLLIYIQADEGYRGPGINTAAAPDEGFRVTGGGEPQRYFKGDDLWSVEAGAKISALDGRLRLAVTSFAVEWKGVQSDQLLPNGLPYTANVGDGQNFGVEFEGAFQTGALQLRGDALFNNPELNRANPAFPVLAGAGLGDVPAQSVGASVHYAWRVGDRERVEIDTHCAYVGGSQLMLNIASLPKMGDYTTGRLATSFVDKNWRVTLSVDNPADVRGNTFAYGNPFTIRFRNQVTPLRPRTVTLGAEASF